MNFLQRAALAGAGAAITSSALAQSAPVAPIKPKVFTDFGVVRTDNYYWLNQPTSPEVLSYLNAENAYYEKQMAAAQGSQKKLVAGNKGTHQAGRRVGAVPRQRVPVLHAV